MGGSFAQSDAKIVKRENAEGKIAAGKKQPATHS